MTTGRHSLMNILCSWSRTWDITIWIAMNIDFVLSSTDYHSVSLSVNQPAGRIPQNTQLGASGFTLLVP